MQALAPLVLAAIIFVPFYVMLIRPHRQRLQEHDALVASLIVGNDVMTSSGFYGTIVELTDDWARLALGPGTEVFVARRAIARVLPDGLPGRPERDAA